MQTAWIVSIGTELSLGQSVDTNSAWLAARLAAGGMRATRHLTIPDELPLIVAAFREAATAADVVLVTGGLGATADDLTREALAEAAGVALETDAASLAAIEAFFQARGRVMPQRNQVQALIPVGGQSLPNPNGTAPGVRVDIAGVPFFAMPGVPREMAPMFENHVAPALPAGRAVIRSRVLHCVGITETELGEKIADLMARGRNPEVGTTAALGIVGVRVNATAPSPQAADELLDSEAGEIRARLGTFVFGRDGETLAAAVGALLAQRGRSVATAESCTAGLIAAQLTDMAGSSRYFLGGAVTYSNESKQRVLGVPAAVLQEHGAVCEATALAMADGARRLFSADYALAVTGIAGPGGGSAEKPVGLVFIALAGPRGRRAKPYQFGHDTARDVIRLRAATTALHVLRLALLEE